MPLSITNIGQHMPHGLKPTTFSLIFLLLFWGHSCLCSAQQSCQGDLLIGISKMMTLWLKWGLQIIIFIENYERSCYFYSGQVSLFPLSRPVLLFLKFGSPRTGEGHLYLAVCLHYSFPSRRGGGNFSPLLAVVHPYPTSLKVVVSHSLPSLCVCVCVCLLQFGFKGQSSAAQP